MEGETAANSTQRVDPSSLVAAAATESAKKLTKKRGAGGKGRKTTNNKKKKLPTNPKPPAPAPTVVKRETNRSSNYINEEDICLARAYINISQDNITGANQGGDRFWKHIKERFDILMNELIDAQTEELEKSGEEDGEVISFLNRTADSLKNRWDKAIAKDVRLFNRFYRESKTPIKSGWSEENYIDDAEYKWVVAEEKTGGKKFRFRHVLEILWKHPSFDPMDEQPNPDNTQKHSEISKCQGGSMTRPIGKKQAQKLLHNSVQSSLKGSSKYEIIRDASDRMTAEFAKSRKISAYKHDMESSMEMWRMAREMDDEEEAKLHYEKFKSLKSGYQSFLESLEEKPANKPPSEIRLENNESLTEQVTAKEQSVTDSGHHKIAGVDDVNEEDDTDNTPPLDSTGLDNNQYEA